MKERRTAGNSQNGLVRVCACRRMCMFVRVFVRLSVFGGALWACQLRRIPEVPSSRASSGAHPANASDTRSTQAENRQTLCYCMCKKVFFFSLFSCLLAHSCLLSAVFDSPVISLTTAVTLGCRVCPAEVAQTGHTRLFAVCKQDPFSASRALCNHRSQWDSQTLTKPLTEGSFSGRSLNPQIISWLRLAVGS